jgi:aconitase A
VTSSVAATVSKPVARSFLLQPEKAGEKHDSVKRLPYSLKILLENLLRHEDGVNITESDIAGLANWDAKAEPDTEIAFTPARVVLQDFTGVPASSTWPPCAMP